MKQIMRILITSLIFVAIIFSYSCDESFNGSLDDRLVYEINYPVAIPAISESERLSLQEAFMRINNYQFCSTLDKFGFLKRDKECNVRFNYWAWITDPGFIIPMAARAVIHNAEFTHVYDSTQLKVKGFRYITLPNGYYQVLFEEQRHRGIKVNFTEIKVDFQCDSVFAITGGWFRDIPVPSKPRYSVDEVKNYLIGKTFRDLKITEQTFNQDTPITEEVYPRFMDDKIEFRIIYRIHIFEGSDSKVYWEIIIDAQNLEIFTTRINIYMKRG
jgi:hypothetical protein